MNSPRALNRKKELQGGAPGFGALLWILIPFLMLLTTTCTLPPTGTPSYHATRIPEGSPSPDLKQSNPEWIALNSLEKVDPYPLYVMTYAPERLTSNPDHTWHTEGYSQSDLRLGSGCSLFAILRDQESLLLGRNFDWRYSPALLLFYIPVDGYPSVAMIDLEYLVEDDVVQRLDELSIEDRAPLLDAIHLPFDGMNANGLVIAMAAVPDSPLPQDPSLETLGSLEIMRRVLDRAGDVEQALEIFAAVKPDWGNGPALHYLVSDRQGRSVLVEFIAGEIVLLEKKGTWQVATNFLQRSADADQGGQCWRFDLLERELTRYAGSLTTDQAMELLASVAQGGAGSSTQWSIIYDFGQGDVNIVLGRKYSTPYQFHFDRFAPRED